MNDKLFLTLVDLMRQTRSLSTMQFFILGQASAYCACGKLHHWQQIYIENMQAAQSRGIAA